MKNLFLSMMIIATMFASCSSDDDNNPGPDGGEITFEDGIISGNIDRNARVTAGRTYTLRGPVYVKSGATLTIEPGVRIEAEYSENVTNVAFLAVERGAMINATGTAENPIVFTSSAATPAAGQWGGIVICGNAGTNKGANAQAEVAGLIYGGDNNADNSGVLSHIIIEYSGNKINDESEFNGLTFYAVGSGTTVNNIFINQVSDDGVEWFGGSVNAENLTVIGSQDDSFDWAEGWNGTVTNLYADQSAATTYSSDSRGIEADSNQDNPTLAPVSSPTLTNLTLIGRNSASVTSEAGMMLRRGTLGSITNVYLKDFIAGEGITASGAESLAHFQANKVKQVRFDNVPNKGTAGTFEEDPNATGAGNGAARPDWSTWAESHLTGN
ncbi:hypothetical protein RYH73_21010 [Olivibacter sp. CPCC 100613]|uniref:hypothetical protein n=1 Tax=Olivibacter sp. CPCC 100613 TaxID=3079931 RepID=UPI002FF88BA2